MSSSVADRDFLNATTSDLSHSDDRDESTSSQIPRFVGKSSVENSSPSPEMFKGYPKASERKLNSNRHKRATSCIPTDTPEKEKIEMRNTKKKEKTIKQTDDAKKEAATKKLFAKRRKSTSKEIISSEEEEEVSLADSDEDGDSTPRT